MKKVFILFCLCIGCFVGFTQSLAPIYITKDDALKSDFFDNAVKIPDGYTLQQFEVSFFNLKKELKLALTSTYVNDKLSRPVIVENIENSTSGEKMNISIAMLSKKSGKTVYMSKSYQFK